MVLDGGALAGEGATEEGPQKGIQDRRHPIDMCARRGPDGPARRMACGSTISGGRGSSRWRGAAARRASWSDRGACQDESNDGASARKADGAWVGGTSPQSKRREMCTCEDDGHHFGFWRITGVGPERLAHPHARKRERRHRFRCSTAAQRFTDIANITSYRVQAALHFDQLRHTHIDLASASLLVSSSFSI